MSSNHTRFFHYTYLGQGDSVVDDNYAFGVADRDLQDLLDYLGISHHHNGLPALGAGAPAVELDLVLDQDQGILPANTTIYYRYTLVDERGFESLPSPEASYTTPANVDAPAAPTLLPINTGGHLLPGTYSYALVAWRYASTLETTGSPQVVITLPVGATTYQVHLNLPPLPANADGFNVYRRAVGEAAFHYLESIDMSIATPPESWTDDGTLTEDCDRGLPSSNTTNAQNSIVVTLPGATPAVPEGFTWRIYRTYTSGAYGSSLLHHVVEETSEGSGVITPTYTDLGFSTVTGQPPTSVFDINNPDPIDLNDGAEVQGMLPPANVAYPQLVEFAFPGPLDIRVGRFVWRCPFDEFYIKHVTGNLGDDSMANGLDDVFDVLWMNNGVATPSWVSIFDGATPPLPFIAVGEQFADEFIPVHTKLLKGDLLRCDVVQVSDAATPTDSDLLIQIVGYARDLTATSIVFP